MLVEYGGVETARRLLGRDVASAGFATLWEIEQLDLSVEAFVLQHGRLGLPAPAPPSGPGKSPG
jgi:hypothetical protein